MNCLMCFLILNIHHAHSRLVVHPALCVGPLDRWWTIGLLQNSWPTYLLKILETRFPCQGGGHHTLHNLCHHSTGASGQLLRIKGTGEWAADAKLIDSADVVLIETGVNTPNIDNPVQVAGQGVDSNIMYKAGPWTELVVRELLTLYGKPSVVWVEAAWWDLAWPPYRNDGSYENLQVLRYYDVPQVSLPDALGPFISTDRRRFIADNVKTDNIHLTTLGEKMVAQTLGYMLQVEMRRFLQVLQEAGAGGGGSGGGSGGKEGEGGEGGLIGTEEPGTGWFRGVRDHGSEPPPRKERYTVFPKRVLEPMDTSLGARRAALPPPFLAPPSIISMFEGVPISSIDFSLASVVNNPSVVEMKDGWEYSQDRANKKATLWGSKVGGCVVIRVGEGVRSLVIELLHSYENVGVATIEVLVGDASGGSRTDWRSATTAAGDRVDCQWTDHASLRAAKIISDFDAPTKGCLVWAKVCVMESDPARKVNKIKLFSMMGLP